MPEQDHASNIEALVASKELMERFNGPREGNQPSTSTELPRYRCHKEVHALKIKEIDVHVLTGKIFLVPEDPAFAQIEISEAFDHKHHPAPGGYYVIYPGDSYASYSPAKAFEEGYTRI